MIWNKDIVSVPSALAQSGVDSPEFTTETLAIREMTGWTITHVRRMPGAEQPQIAPIEWPQNIGECFGNNPAVLCLSPGEWLLLDHADDAGQSATGSVREKRDVFWSDLSDGLAVFRIEGAGAPWLLNKISGLDYQSCHGAKAHGARTRMGQVAVVVHFHRLPDNRAVFDLVVDRSIARYLWELLCASAPHADDLTRADNLQEQAA